MKIKGYSKKRMFGLLLLPALACSLVDGVSVSPAAAANVTVPPAITTSTVQLTGTDLLTVTSTGVIDLSGQNAVEVGTAGPATGVTINNSGKIISDSYYAGIAIDGTATGTTITNLAGGLVSATGSASAISYWGDMNGSLTNAGSIVAGGGTSNTWASAIYISGNLAGMLTNSGLIDASADYSSSSVYASGIYVGGNLSGQLNNSGTIRATAQAYHSYTYVNATAYGMNIGGDVVGSLSNSGTISGDAMVSNTTSSYSGSAYAYGVNMGSLAGTLTNTSSGTISANAEAYNTYSYANAYAYGLNMGDILAAGKLDNSGTISANAEAYDQTDSPYAYAYGVNMGNIDAGGSLINSGTIRATATASAISPNSSAYAYAYGVNLGDLSGKLENSGTIIAKATATNGATSYPAYAYAYGVSMDSLYGELTNTSTGTISATASANGGYGAYASAIGVSMGALISPNTLINNGAISATAIASGQSSNDVTAYAYGIYINGSFDGTLTNSGTISATATGYNDTYDIYAYAYGVNMGDLAATGLLTNSGTISAKATVLSGTTTGSSNTAYAYGINMGSIDGILTNSGSIAATAQATNYDGTWYSAYASAYGINMGALNGTLTNTSSGTISATATAKQLNNQNAYAYAYGINMGDIAATKSLTNAGMISAIADASAVSSSATATAYGISMGALNGTLTNSNTGSITAKATVGNVAADAFPSAYGISMGDIAATGKLDNAGNISATATGTNRNVLGPAGNQYISATAVGINMWTLSGELKNSGAIRAEAKADVYHSYAGAFASGISMGDIAATTGKLDNSGTISAMATAISTAPASAAYPSASAYATGISMGSLYGTLTNSSTGTISATASVNANNLSGMTYTGAYAYGVSMGDLAGTLNNGGTISASATNTIKQGSYAWASAYGVGIWGTQSGTFDNSGTISATANAISTGSASDSAYGVYVGNLTGTLNNSGTISGLATLPEDGYSLYVSGGSGAVNNLTGGLLSGNLYVASSGAVSNSGTIDLPANADGFALASVAGNYTQSAGGTLEVGAHSTTNYARLGVGGTAAFEAGTGLTVDVASGNLMVNGDVVPDVVTAGTLAATGFTLIDNNALLDFSAVIDGNTVDLNVASVPVASIIAAYGPSSAAGAALAFDSMLGTFDPSNPTATPMGDVLMALRDMQTGQEVADAVTQTLPTLNVELSGITLANLRNTSHIIRARQNGDKGLSSGNGTPGGKNFWGKAFGSVADQDDDNGAFGYDADTYGLMFGVDTELCSRATLGAALAYSTTDVQGDTIADQDADITSYQAALYGSVKLTENNELGWQVGFGMHDNEVERSIPFMGVTAEGDYDSVSFNIGVDADHQFVLDEITTLTPSVRLDYARVEADSYNEKGAGGLSLDVDDENVDELVLGVDAKLAVNVSESMMLSANAGAGYDFLADEGSLTAAYAGAPGVAFKTTGIDPSHWLYRGGVGMTVGGEDSMQVTVRGDLEGREDYLNKSVSVKINVPF